jgi:hypothetical protein
VVDALRLGCVGIGYTIYPGTALRCKQYEQLRELTREAKAAGLAVIVWSYPRGGGLSKAGETALDVTAYAAHIAAELGAHVIKVKLPSAHLELEAAGRCTRRSRFREKRWRIGYDMSCRVLSMAVAWLYFPAARRRRMIRPFWTRRGPSVMVVVLAPLSGATFSSDQRKTHCVCWMA